MPLTGLSIISFESRRAELVQRLVSQYGGASVNAPSVRERPLESNEQCLRFIEDVIGGAYEAIVFTSGVGVQYIVDAATAVGRRAPFLDGLRRAKTVVRGPKPSAVLRPLDVTVTMSVPEPNTWREIADAMKELPAASVAVQEYGAQNPELLALLRERKMKVTPVPVYRWDLPEDTAPLERAARDIAASRFDIALFLSSVQLTHLLEVAARAGLRASVIDALRNNVVVASIGPVMSDTLAREGLSPDFCPKHPKLAVCVRQLAQEAAVLVTYKRRSAG